MGHYQTFHFRETLFLLTRAKTRTKSPFAQETLLEKGMRDSVPPGMRYNRTEERNEI